MNMVNTTYNSTDDMNNKLQSLKGEAQLNFIKLNKYYDEMKNQNIRFEEDPFSKNVHGVSKIYHEVLLLMKFPQTKP